MEEFLLKAMQISLQTLNEWNWYVDDSEIKCIKEDAQQILDHLTNIEPGVTVFTKEDPDDVLPVLDLETESKQENKEN